MSLKTCKDHEKGFFEKKKLGRSILSFTLLVTLCICSGFSTLSLKEYNVYNNSNKQTKYTISEYADESIKPIYDSNSIFGSLDNYFESKNYYLSTLPIDEIITKKNLAIDLSVQQDIGFLSECSNLENIIIFNSQLLTKDNINILKNMKCNNIKLSFGRVNDIIKRCPEKLDLLPLENKNVKIYLESNNTELTTYITLMFLNNYKKEWFMDNIDFIMYENIDSYLNDVISNMDIKPNVNDYNNIMNIISATTYLINYDPVVSNNNHQENPDSTIALKADKNVRYYNKYLLTSVLTGEKNQYGICANYAAVMTALCNKLGIQCFYVCGSEKAEKLTDVNDISSHAWCVVLTDVGYKIVDVTALDNEYDNFRNLKIEDKKLYINDIEKNTFEPEMIDDRYEINITEYSNDEINRNSYNDEIVPVGLNRVILDNYSGDKILTLLKSIVPAEMAWGVILITITLKKKEKENKNKYSDDKKTDEYFTSPNKM